MKKWISENLVHICIICIFIILSCIYFSPVFQGKALYQGDVLEAKAMQREIMSIKEATGTAPLWTNAMFGGMPSFQIWTQYPANVTSYVFPLFQKIFPTDGNVPGSHFSASPFNAV